MALCGPVPCAKLASSLSIVICASSSLGRTGPVKRMTVGRLWPNRSTSPGPDALSLGAVVPTLMIWPATVTVCIGVTRSATTIATAATAASPATLASSNDS